jgi:alkylresorcinol/alkylpyrone synthase
MDLQRGDLKESRDVLRQFGNMSAVTVLFVAERMRLMGQQTLLTALGPGFSAVFLMLDGR